MGRYEYFLMELSDEMTVEAVMDRLGQFLEIAIEHMGISPDDAINAFVDSGLARNFEMQASPFVLGMSGSELVEWALDHMGRPELAESVPADATVGFAIPYWIGQMVGYFQVTCGMTYRRIFECVSYDRLRELALAYGECTPDEFIPVLKRVIEEHPWDSELKRRRKLWGMTQSELARRASVSLRAVQQYEQGTKDIRKAAVDTVYRLSLALRCSIEDLI